MLVGLARRRTDQPQSWALVPALGLGVAGLALLILGPSDRVLGRMGWVWPLLLALVVVWSVRGARRSLHNWSRRALLYPAFAVLALVAHWRRIRNRHGGGDEQQPASRRPHLPRRWPQPVSALYGFGVSGCDLVQWAWERTPSWAWVRGDVERQTRRLCLRSRGSRLEWKGARSPGRASAFGRRARPSCGCQCSRAICSRRSLSRWHICTRLRDGLSKGRGRGRAARLGHPISV